VTFGDEFYEPYYYYGGLLQNISFTTCLILLSKESRRTSTFMLMSIYLLYAQFCDVLFGDINAVYYLMESLLFTVWAAYIMFRPERRTPKTINYDNILLAFYKGDGGSKIMGLGGLFGDPVKSMCIIAGKHALVLKSSKDGFQFIDSKNILRLRSDYAIVDSGQPYTKEYIEMMGKYHNKPASKKGLRMRCIEGVKPLLKEIGTEFEPTFLEQNPAIYFRKVG